MKKLLLLGAMALATVSMSAQDLAGKMFVGGSFGYTQDKKIGDTRAKTYSVMPTVGKFISSDMAVGVSLGYKGGKDGGKVYDQAGELIDASKSNGFVINPFARKYFALGNAGFHLFGEAGLPIEFYHISGADKANNFDINVDLNVGFDYIINSKISFETKLNLFRFGYSNNNPYSGKSSNAMNFGFNPTKNVGDFTVGVKFLF